MQQMGSDAADGQRCSRWAAMQQMGSDAADGQRCSRWAVMQQMGSDAADGQWYFDDSSAGGKCVAEQEIDQPWKRLTDTPHIISSHHLLTSFPRII
jgi:hypothetical protein